MFSLSNGKLIRINSDGSDGETIQTTKNILKFGTSILFDHFIRDIGEETNICCEITTDDIGRIFIVNKSDKEIIVNDKSVSTKRPLFNNSTIHISKGIRFRWVYKEKENSGSSELNVADFASWSEPQKRVFKESKLITKKIKGRLTSHPILNAMKNDFEVGSNNEKEPINEIESQIHCKENEEIHFNSKDKSVDPFEMETSRNNTSNNMSQDNHINYNIQNELMDCNVTAKSSDGSAITINSDEAVSNQNVNADTDELFKHTISCPPAQLQEDLFDSDNEMDVTDNLQNPTNQNQLSPTDHSDVDSNISLAECQTNGDDIFIPETQQLQSQDSVIDLITSTEQTDFSFAAGDCPDSKFQNFSIVSISSDEGVNESNLELSNEHNSTTSTNIQTNAKMLTPTTINIANETIDKTFEENFDNNNETLLNNVSLDESQSSILLSDEGKSGEFSECSLSNGDKNITFPKENVSQIDILEDNSESILTHLNDDENQINPIIKQDETSMDKYDSTFFSIESGSGEFIDRVSSNGDINMTHSKENVSKTESLEDNSEFRISKCLTTEPNLSHLNYEENQSKLLMKEKEALLDQDESIFHSIEGASGDFCSIPVDEYISVSKENVSQIENQKYISKCLKTEAISTDLNDKKNQSNSMIKEEEILMDNDNSTFILSERANGDCASIPVDETINISKENVHQIESFEDNSEPTLSNEPKVNETFTETDDQMLKLLDSSPENTEDSEEVANISNFPLSNNEETTKNEELRILESTSDSVKLSVCTSPRKHFNDQIQLTLSVKTNLIESPEEFKTQLSVNESNMDSVSLHSKRIMNVDVTNLHDSVTSLQINEKNQLLSIVDTDDKDLNRSDENFDNKTERIKLIKQNVNVAQEMLLKIKSPLLSMRKMKSISLVQNDTNVEEISTTSIKELDCLNEIDKNVNSEEKVDTSMTSMENVDNKNESNATTAINNESLALIDSLIIKESEDIIETNEPNLDVVEEEGCYVVNNKSIVKYKEDANSKEMETNELLMLTNYAATEQNENDSSKQIVEFDEPIQNEPSNEQIDDNLTVQLVEENTQLNTSICIANEIIDTSKEDDEAKQMLESALQIVEHSPEMKCSILESIENRADVLGEQLNKTPSKIKAESPPKSQFFPNAPSLEELQTADRLYIRIRHPSRKISSSTSQIKSPLETHCYPHKSPNKITPPLLCSRDLGIYMTAMPQNKTKTPIKSTIAKNEKTPPFNISKDSDGHILASYSTPSKRSTRRKTCNDDKGQTNLLMTPKKLLLAQNTSNKLRTPSSTEKPTIDIPCEKLIVNKSNSLSNEQHLSTDHPTEQTVCDQKSLVGQKNVTHLAESNELLTPPESILDKSSNEETTLNRPNQNNTILNQFIDEINKDESDSKYEIIKNRQDQDLVTPPKSILDKAKAGGSTLKRSIRRKPIQSQLIENVNKDESESKLLAASGDENTKNIQSNEFATPVKSILDKAKAGGSTLKRSNRRQPIQTQLTEKVNNDESESKLMAISGDENIKNIQRNELVTPTKSILDVVQAEVSTLKRSNRRKTIQSKLIDEIIKDENETELMAASGDEITENILNNDLITPAKSILDVVKGERSTLKRSNRRKPIQSQTIDEEKFFETIADSEATGNDESDEFTSSAQSSSTEVNSNESVHSSKRKKIGKQSESKNVVVDNSTPNNLLIGSTPDNVNTPSSAIRKSNRLIALKMKSESMENINTSTQKSNNYTYSTPVKKETKLVRSLRMPARQKLFKPEPETEASIKNLKNLNIKLDELTPIKLQTPLNTVASQYKNIPSLERGNESLKGDGTATPNTEMKVKGQALSRITRRPNVKNNNLTTPNTHSELFATEWNELLETLESLTDANNINNADKNNQINELGNKMETPPTIDEPKKRGPQPRKRNDSQISEIKRAESAQRSKRAKKVIENIANVEPILEMEPQLEANPIPLESKEMIEEPKEVQLKESITPIDEEMAKAKSQKTKTENFIIEKEVLRRHNVFVIDVFSNIDPNDTPRSRRRNAKQQNDIDESNNEIKTKEKDENDEMKVDGNKRKRGRKATLESTKKSKPMAKNSSEQSDEESNVRITRQTRKRATSKSFVAQDNLTNKKESINEVSMKMRKTRNTKQSNLIEIPKENSKDEVNVTQTKRTRNAIKKASEEIMGEPNILSKKGDDNLTGNRTTRKRNTKKIIETETELKNLKNTNESDSPIATRTRRHK